MILRDGDGVCLDEGQETLRRALEAVVWCHGSGAMRFLGQGLYEQSAKSQSLHYSGTGPTLNSPCEAGSTMPSSAGLVLLEADCHLSRWGNCTALVHDGQGGMMRGEGQWLEPKPCVNTSSSRRKVSPCFLQGKKLAEGI